jgi:hypothetical protein
MVKELEDQAQKDAEAVKGKGKGKEKEGAKAGEGSNPQGDTGGKYGRLKGQSLGGGVKAGAYRKQSVDDTLPSILQRLIEKQRTAREIIESGDASRYGELPNLYGEIRGLEQKRDKVIQQVSNPVDDNKDTKYVVQQYDRFLVGKKAHFGVKGKKEKYPFSSGGKEYTEDEIRFAMTRSSVVPGLNKAGLASKQQTRDRFGNALAMPDDFKQGLMEKMPKTEEQKKKYEEKSPAQISEERTKQRNRIFGEGYKAYKKNDFNDDGSVKRYSSEYAEWLKKHASKKGEEDASNKKFGKKYMKEDYKPPRRKSQQQPPKEEESKTESTAGLRGRRNPATSSSTSSTKSEVGMPNEKSTRKDLVGEFTGDVNPFMMFGNSKGEVEDGLKKARTDRDFKSKDAKTGYSADDVYIGWALTHFGDPDWLAKNPPGSAQYETTKAGLDYYTSIGVEPAYQYPEAPPATSSASEGSSSTDPPKTEEKKAEEKHPTSEGVKSSSTDADGDTTSTQEPYMSAEEKQEEADKVLPKTEVKDAPTRPGTTEEYDVLDADRGAPMDTPMPPPNMPMKPSDIAKRRSDDIAEENRQRGKASIKRLKEEIRAYHLVYDNNIKEFRENPHKKEKDDALQSNDIDVVRAHHKRMEEKIREYYRSGDADSLNVGVIVPIDTYLQQYLTRSVPQMSNIQPPRPATTGSTLGATHRHQHLTKKGHDPFGHSIAQGTYYQRGGISSYKQQPVANHTIRIKGKVSSAPIADPKVYVDAPMNNFLQRPLKLKSSLKIKS